MRTIAHVAVGLLVSACAVTWPTLPQGSAAEESPAPPARPRVTARRLVPDDKEVVVLVDGAVFTRYKFADTLKFPYFFPLNGPRTGASVTTESSEPYPHHHSLFLGCDRVNGGNYWQEGLERGRIDSRARRVVEEESGRSVVIEDRCVWVRPGAPDVFEDLRTWTISAPRSDLRLIEADIKLEALVDVRIERTNHSLFSMRVVSGLSPAGGGTLLDSEGHSGEKATFGKKAKWCGFHGAREGAVEGIAILDHPENPWSPCPWFTRDYGFASPTPMQWLEGGELRIAKGDTLRLRYLVVVHSGTPAEAKLEAIWEGWTAGTAAPPEKSEGRGPAGAAGK